MIPDSSSDGKSSDSPEVTQQRAQQIDALPSGSFCQRERERERKLHEVLGGKTTNQEEGAEGVCVQKSFLRATMIFEVLGKDYNSLPRPSALWEVPP